MVRQNFYLSAIAVLHISWDSFERRQAKDELAESFMLARTDDTFQSAAAAFD